MPFGVLVAKDFHIIWLSNILALSLRDEDYSKSVSCALILIFPFFFFFSYYYILTWQNVIELQKIPFTFYREN
jgi:hypothetical protein